MNHKQKLGYMALGAGILALGIITRLCRKRVEVTSCEHC